MNSPELTVGTSHVKSGQPAPALRVPSPFSALLPTVFQELARCGMRGVQSQHLGKMLPSLGEAALLGQGHAQMIVRVHIAGPEPQRLGIVLDGLGEVPLVGQGSPQVVMGFSKVGLEAECFCILLDSFLYLPLSVQDIA
jgi:hypothetical protein